jgi:antitoxin MazE6
MPQSNGYTSGMKTAVSLPDDLFKGAENLRHRLKISRSEVYRRAIAEYLLRHSPDQIREALDETVAAVGQEQDEFVRAAGRRLLKRVEW